MKVLILGGTGAMGAPLVDILSDQGHEVYVTSRKQQQTALCNVHYIVGNAKDNAFLESILNKNFDVLIDFMFYHTEEFKSRINILLRNVNQYIFLSSSRVFSNLDNELIDEDSPRLLDTLNDNEYLSTDEYALAKAREEDLLKRSMFNNWTIIRPYITYNDERLQLGSMEKEIWLHRAMNGKSIIFSKDVAEKYTTLTNGYDVAYRISKLMGNEKVLCQIYNIASCEYIKWKEVLNIYLNELECILRKRPNVIWLDTSSQMMSFLAPYPIKYDRMFNRKFNNHKIQDILEENISFIETQNGLKKCLDNFIYENHNFRFIDYKVEGKIDRITGEKSDVFQIKGLKNRVKYIIYRFIIPTNTPIYKKNL